MRRSVIVALVVAGDAVLMSRAGTAQTPNGAALLTLYFESRDGHWAPGTYHLSMDDGRARATIPIELK